MVFTGAGLSKAEYEERALRVDPVHREGESDLAATRWFDYSGMHPAAATYLYAYLYRRQTRKFYEMCVDIETAATVKAFTPDDIFLSRDMTAMWCARRCADKHGAPYDFVLEFAQHRAFERYFKRFPRPNQLYTEEFEIDLTEAWRERKATMLTYSRHPGFKIPNFKGLDVQRRHKDFLIDQIKARPVHHTLLGRTFHEAIMDEEYAAQHFPAETISQAREIAAKLAR